ncbi:hypothetical protein R6Q57_011032 [Mikania cordata]
MAFTNKFTDPVSLEKGVIEDVLSEMGYKGVYPMLQKKLLIPYWRYIAHIFMVCMSGNKGTFDMLKKDQSSAFVVLAMNWGFKFSKCILNEMKGNLKGSKSERFMMYPRFLQMIFDEIFPGLQRGVVTRDLKVLSESTFPLIMQNRGGKYKFEGLHPLKKFGQFAEIEEGDVVEAAEIPNAFIEKEHDTEVMNSRPSDEDVYVVKIPEYEDVVTGDEPDMDFDFEIETIPIESDPPEQVNLLTTENLEALLEQVKRSVGNPLSAPSFVDQEPPQDDVAYLVPRKRRRRDPRPGVIVSELDTEPILETQIQTITAEPTKSLPKFKESAAGSSSHTKDIDYDSFLVRETRVFELEQDSLSHTLLIQELKTNNELKDKKIKDLETNTGHLSAIVLDLKQKLQDKFKGEFIDESSPSNTVEPAPEMSKANFNELTRSREEGIRKYFAGDTGFKSIKTKKKTDSLGNPIDIDIFEVTWLATNWMKKVHILLDLPEGNLDDFKFWAFDE